MLTIDGQNRETIDAVVGLDLSLTAPGVAAIYEPWGFAGEEIRAAAFTLSRVPTTSSRRGVVLLEAAERIVDRVLSMCSRSSSVLVVMEALLLQSGTGKAPERAALWWITRGSLERSGFVVTSVHPTTRKSLALDDQGRADLKAMDAETRKKRAKAVGLASMRRRWPGVVFPDDNASDALACADVGARALGWVGMPELENKNLQGAIDALGITKGNEK